MVNIFITPEQLNKICPTMKPERAKILSDLLNELCPKYGITEKLPFQMFLGNVAQESSEFAHKEENMNYSAERLTKVWPGRFPTIDSAAPYAHQPGKLANLVYGGRMGNTEPGDGSYFKGGGFIGITGRDLYQKYAEYKKRNIELVVAEIHGTDRYALDSACWFFAVLKNLIPVALTGNFKGVCSLINTGSINKPAIGQDVRDKYLERCKRVLG